MTLAPSFFISLFITLAFLPIFKAVAQKARIMDIPDERKVHSRPIPKIGGLAMSLGFCISILIWLPADRFVVAALVGMAILVAEGFVDDIICLGYKTKFIAQIVAALVVILYGGIRITVFDPLFLPGSEWSLTISIPLTLVVVVGITNAINLADGLDGLAGGIALIIFLCLCVLSYGSGDDVVLIMSLSMLGTLFGFLCFNTYPALVFMGDAGSQFIGFITIILSLRLTQGGESLSPFLPLLIIGFPVIDTAIVMIERIARGDSPFIADHNHFHHKLLGTGFFHTEAVFIIYLIQSVYVLSAYFLSSRSGLSILAFYLFLSGMICMFSHAVCRRRIRIRRVGFMDMVGRFLSVENEKKIVRLCAIILYMLPPALLFVNCFYASDLPYHISLLSFVMASMIICLWIMRNRLLSSIVRMALYFMIPASIYFNQEQSFSLREWSLGWIYIFLCLMCILSAFILVRGRSPETSFRTSPMDFLVIAITLCVPPLLESVLDVWRTLMFLIQILILFYTYEIMLNGQEKGKKLVAATTVGALLIIALKGIH
ncbi:MAG TPA: MraY family glycosyltransferase [Deltaproteobacteria bacterium]|nr:MraY family glycosyltransferase [Deltaproteobacteria bacterium]